MSNNIKKEKSRPEPNQPKRKTFTIKQSEGQKHLTKPKVRNKSSNNNRNSDKKPSSPSQQKNKLPSTFSSKSNTPKRKFQRSKPEYRPSSKGNPKKSNSKSWGQV